MADDLGEVGGHSGRPHGHGDGPRCPARGRAETEHGERNQRQAGNSPSDPPRHPTMTVREPDCFAGGQTTVRACSGNTGYGAGPSPVSGWRDDLGMAVLVQLDGIARRVNEEGLPVVIDAHGVADGDTVTPKLVHHRVHVGYQ